MGSNYGKTASWYAGAAAARNGEPRDRTTVWNAEQFQRGWDSVPIGEHSTGSNLRFAPFTLADPKVAEEVTKIGMETMRKLTAKVDGRHYQEMPCPVTDSYKKMPRMQTRLNVMEGGQMKQWDAPSDTALEIEMLIEYDVHPDSLPLRDGEFYVNVGKSGATIDEGRTLARVTNKGRKAINDIIQSLHGHSMFHGTQARQA